MNHQDIERIIKRYSDRYTLFGYSPQTLGWGKGGRQNLRFSILANDVLRQPKSSVLDVGCGFADLFEFLKNNGWQGQYTGIDIVPKLVEEAKERHPDAKLSILGADDLGQTGEHDFVLASGIFNGRLVCEPNKDFAERVISKMFAAARQGVCVDFMSTWVDFQHEDAWHFAPEEALALGRQLSKRLLLRLDYMPYEYSLIIYKDDSIAQNNTFT
ncbi:class I SAM-dependent methyltransferase [Maridesulfovibrio sp.]|uniref:class I SAM-dependent methyltransferase n=1 Tax=Maridesulfovibrio sp. TaxID=2795000 RepID=UPI003BAC9426